jgi:hypothetical protein
VHLKKRLIDYPWVEYFFDKRKAKCCTYSKITDIRNIFETAFKLNGMYVIRVNEQ